VSGPALVAVLPIAIWEFSLGVWLTVKGFTSPPINRTATVETLSAAMAATV
jgi:hypothetical protein